VSTIQEEGQLMSSNDRESDLDDVVEDAEIDDYDEKRVKLIESPPAITRTRI
jgi:hypothetical protein